MLIPVLRIQCNDLKKMIEERLRQDITDDTKCELEERLYCVNLALKELDDWERKMREVEL